MSEISEKAIKLIKDLRRDISIDIMFTPEKNAEDDSLKQLVDYIAELEGENAGLKERVAMLDVTAVYKSLGKMGYIEQVDKLNARIAELEAAQRWIPVSERLPELGKVVVVHDANDIPYFTRQDLTYAVAVLIEKNNVKMFGFIEEFSVWFSSDVTHWMPLPQPPEVQE